MFNFGKKPESITAKLADPVALQKFRIAYVAVQHEKTMRTRPEDGLQEVLDDRISFRQEASPTIEARTVEEAVAIIKKSLPPNVEFTFQAHPISNRE